MTSGGEERDVIIEGNPTSILKRNIRRDKERINEIKIERGGSL